MVICFFSTQYLPTPGGVERYTWNLARRCVAAGHRALVVTASLPGLPARERDADGIEIYRLPSWPVMGGRFPVLKPFADADDLWAQGIDFAVIQTRMYTQSVWAARQCKRRGIPALVIDHSTGYMMHGGAAGLAGALVIRAALMVVHREFLTLLFGRAEADVMEHSVSYLMWSAPSLPLAFLFSQAGGVLRGAIKSSVGMGVLLSEGIGDTLRVSLTAAPEEEMTVAWELLRALGLRQRGPEIISCPTCGRTEIDLIGLAQEVERRLRTENAPIKVAVMGCVVNGPGEAREADLGMAGGRDKGIIFRKGEVIRSVRGQEALLAAFMEELDKLLVERRDL